MRQLKDWKKKELFGKRVFVRIDCNVPIHRGRIGEDWRLRAVLPTIEYLQKNGAKIIIAGHMGRPEGKHVSSLSLEPVARHLQKLLKCPVIFSSECVGRAVQKKIASLPSGGIILLENLRFDPGEDASTISFSKALASLADFYVDDAFANAHRAAASMVGIASYLPSAAGMLLAKEISILSELAQKPKSPLFVIIGGAKVDTKIGVIRQMAKRARAVAIGGALVIPFLVAKRISVGASPVKAEEIAVAKKLLRLKNLLLPIDVVVAKSPDGTRRVCDVHAIGRDDVIYDLGPKTLSLFQKQIQNARTIIWNGPIGFFEKKKFATGTKQLARTIAARHGRGIQTVVGGGETIQAIRQQHLGHRFHWVSTGGGAMLEFLEGKKLPGIEALRK